MAKASKLRKVRRSRRGQQERSKAALRLEALEQRVLLDVAGVWDELGWRSATGGGVSWDPNEIPGDAQLVDGGDGDPVVFWTEGTLGEWVEEPYFRWEMQEGTIHARQYAGEVGWADLTAGSGDPAPTPGDALNYYQLDPDIFPMVSQARHMSAASGPDGRLAVTWVAAYDYDDSNTFELGEREVWVRLWDEGEWGEVMQVTADGVENVRPDIAFSADGEVYVSYTAPHPSTGQDEIVVQRYGYEYGETVNGPPNPETDIQWTEVAGAETGAFGEEDYSGASADGATSRDSALAVDAEGRPIVAWASMQSEGNWDIMVRRFDGSEWVEWGRGSASDLNGDGHGGVSNDAGVSLQPDVAVAANGDVIVAWVNWSDWENYDQTPEGGAAGIYVRVLDGGAADGSWRAYGSQASVTGEGIAPVMDDPATPLVVEELLGWWYQPSVDVTSDGRPLVTWQGWGGAERYAVNQDNDINTPNLPSHPSTESPRVGVYASVYDAANGFTLLAAASDATGTRATHYSTVNGVPQPTHGYMPASYVGPNDELVMAYTWRDQPMNPNWLDSEVYVQVWDTAAGDWLDYGRGGRSNGNDLWGGDNSSGWFIEESWEYMEGETQVGLIDYDGDPSTQEDVLLANGEHVYVYNRRTGAWSLLDPPLRAGTQRPYGAIFDLKGEPEVEYDVAGDPLLAYVDTDPTSPTYRQVYVAQWHGGGWHIVGNGPANDTTAPITVLTPQDNTVQNNPLEPGVAVQAGPNGSIMVVYTAWNGTSVDAYARTWNGTSWADAAITSDVLAPSILQAVYYSNYDGSGFDDDNLTTLDPNEQGVWEPEYEDYVPGDWYFDPRSQPVYRRDDLLRTEIDATAGPEYVLGVVDDYALVQSVVIPELWNTDGVEGALLEHPSFDDGATVTSLLDYSFRLINGGHVIVDTMVDFNTLNMDAKLYWSIDGNLVDADPNDRLELTPAVWVRDGSQWGWTENTTVPQPNSNAQGGAARIVLDTKAVGLDPLDPGLRRVSLVLEGEVASEDLGPDIMTDENGENPERRFDFVYDATEEEAAGRGDWTYADDGFGAESLGTWLAGAGRDDKLGVATDGLALLLGNAGAAGSFSGYFEKTVDLAAGEDLFVEFYVKTNAAASLAAGDTLDIMVELIGPGGNVSLWNGNEEKLYEQGDHQVESVADGGADITYNGGDNPLVARTVSGLSDQDANIYTAPVAGTYTLRVGAVLNDAAGASVAAVAFDDISVETSLSRKMTDDFDNPLLEGWRPYDEDLAGADLVSYMDLTGEGFAGIIVDAGAGDGKAAMEYEFTFGGPVGLDFYYQVDATLSGDVFIMVAIDGEYITRTEADDDLGVGSPLRDLERIVVETGTFMDAMENVEFTLEGIGNVLPQLDALTPGPHTIRIEVRTAGGVALGGFDGIRLYGIETDAADLANTTEVPSWMATEPHRAQVRVDNFSVYQRMIPDSGQSLLDVDMGFESNTEDLTSPVGWSYTDVTDPAVGTWKSEGRLGVGDGGLYMLLGSGTDDTEANLEGEFAYSFTAGLSGFLGLELDYRLASGAMLPEGTELTMEVSVRRGGTTEYVLHQDVLVSSGGGAVSTGWRELDFIEQSPGTGSATYSYTTLTDSVLMVPPGGMGSPVLAAGNYQLVISAELSAGVDAVAAGGLAGDGQGVLNIDNFKLNYFTGMGVRRFRPGWSNDVADNDYVGPDPNPGDQNRVSPFNFAAAMESELAAGGQTQRLVIEDMKQGKRGDMVVGFRYSVVVPPPFNELTVTARVTNPTESELDLSTEQQLAGGWWNLNRNDPQYSWATITIPDVPSTLNLAQDHTVTLEITGAGSLFIDDVVVLSSVEAHSARPILGLTPGGGNNRDFVVGLQSVSAPVLAYADNADVYPDGMVTSAQDPWFRHGFVGGHVVRLDQNSNAWRQYGDRLNDALQVNFARDVDGDLLPGATYSMPGGGINLIEDMAVGPDGTLLVALQQFGLDWVDTNNDDIIDQADIHPWVDSSPQSYWHEETSLDVAVWSWDPFNIPTDVTGQTQRWEDMGLVPVREYWRYSDLQLVSSAGQMPTVAFSGRGERNAYGETLVQRYTPAGWEVLGSESIQSTGAGGYWSGNIVRDLIVQSSAGGGYPIVSYFAGHMGTDAVREFRRESTLPLMSLTEGSGENNDNRLDFGSTVTAAMEEVFSITNNGEGDLVIYGVEFGGYGNLGSSPFSLTPEPQFPITLEPEDQVAFRVTFDPAGLPIGEYNAVAMVHTNMPTTLGDARPYGHFHEVQLDAEVATMGEVNVPQNRSYLRFDDTDVNATTQVLDGGAPAKVEIWNQPTGGVGDLTVRGWRFVGDAFAVHRAFVRTADGGIEPVALTNPAGPVGDVVLAPGSKLELWIEFTPGEIGVFNDTLYIHSNDSDEEVIPVTLTGRSLSGALVVVEENAGVANDDLVDFGRVVMGQWSQPEEVTIRNEGSTDLEIYRIAASSSDNVFAVTIPGGLRPSLAEPLVIPAGEEFTFTVQFRAEPGDQGSKISQDYTGELEFTTNVPDQPVIELELAGTAVPLYPLIEISESSGANSDDNKLEFGTIGVGQSVTQQFVIENVGGADLRVTQLLLPANGAYTVSPVEGAMGAFTLAPNESRAFVVTYHPTQVGDGSDFEQLLVYFENQNSRQVSPVKVQLDGRVRQPGLVVTDSVAPESDLWVDFGGVATGTTHDETVTLRNTGNSPVTLTGWGISEGSEWFAVSPAAGGAVTLAPGQTYELTVRVDTDATGSVAGVLAITSDDAGQGLWEVNLTAQGVEAGEPALSDSQDSTPEGEIAFTGIISPQLGMSSSTERLTIENIWQSELIVTGIELRSADGQLIDSSVSPFRLLINGRPVAISQASASDDVTLAAAGQANDSMMLDVAFAPQNAYNGTAYVTIYTTVAGGATNVTQARLDGQSVWAMAAGELPATRVSKQVFWDADQDQVQVTVRGGGYATVILTNGGASGGDIEEIRLYETTERTTLTVTSRGETAVYRIVGDTAGRIVLRGVTLDGTGATEPVVELGHLSRQLMVDAVTDGADIEIGSTDVRGLDLRLGAVGEGTDVDVNGDLRSLMVDSFGSGSVQAQSILRLMSRGDFGADVDVEGELRSAVFGGSEVSGDFTIGGELRQLNAAQALYSGEMTADSIGKVSFGELLNADLSASHDIGRVAVGGDMTSSRVLAGYDPLTGSLASGSIVQLVQVRGRVADSTVAAGVRPYTASEFFEPDFENDTVSGSVGQVRFGSVVWDNDDAKFGVAARSSIGRVTAGGQSFGPGDGTVDFVVRLLRD